MDRLACVDLPRLRRPGRSPWALETESAELVAILSRFSPHIETSKEEGGLFWLDVGGLVPLFPSLEEWAQTLARELAGPGHPFSLVVGWGRFALHAIARAAGGAASTRVLVLDSLEQERSLLCRVPLSRLGFDRASLGFLDRLGVSTVGMLLRLPPAGLLESLGKEARRLFAMASGELDMPASRVPASEALQAGRILEQAVSDRAVILALVADLLSCLLARLEGSDKAVSTVHLQLASGRHDTVVESLALSCPTLDHATILELARLRLETVELSAAVTELTVSLEAERVPREQLRMFDPSGSRDLEAGSRALDRIRAAFGEDSVLRAALEDRHLPEASFSWRPCPRLAAARPRKGFGPCMVRRILPRPLPLPGPPRARATAGPYIISGAWWQGRSGQEELCREYYFAVDDDGRLLWVYRDRGAWFLQGRIE